MPRRDNCCPSHIGIMHTNNYHALYAYTNNYHGNKDFYNNLPNNQHRNAIASFECYKFEYVVSDDI